MSDKPGVCPKCGEKIEYRSHIQFKDQKESSWVCNNCGTWGREVYDIVFRGHEDTEEMTRKMNKRMREENM